MQLGAEFTQNLGAADAAETVELPASAIRWLSPSARQQASFSFDGGTARIRADRGTTAEVLKHVPDSAARKKMYLAYHAIAKPNLAVLDRVLHCRRTLAQMMGHTSYGDYVAKNMMTGSAANVGEFLTVKRPAYSLFVSILQRGLANLSH